MILTKADIVEVIEKRNGYTINRFFELIEILLEIIKSQLKSGQDVLISGFGKFCVKEKKECLGRNPANGEAMMLNLRKTITFRCSRKLRDKVSA